MTLLQAIAKVPKGNADVCVTTMIRTKKEFEKLENTIASIDPSCTLVCSYNNHQNIPDCFYYYPYDRYYGHYNLKELKECSEVIMFTHNKKAEILAKIKYYKE